MRPTSSVVLAVLAVATLPTGSLGEASGSSIRTVRIKDIDFAPRAVTIRRGSTVRWSFLDRRVPHNVTSSGGRRFRSSPTKSKGTYSVRFRRAGTYRYVCTIHLNMRGRVAVH